MKFSAPRKFSKEQYKTEIIAEAEALLDEKIARMAKCPDRTVELLNRAEMFRAGVIAKLTLRPADWFDGLSGGEAIKNIQRQPGEDDEPR